jgi:hypothetical protein
MLPRVNMVRRMMLITHCFLLRIRCQILFTGLVRGLRLSLP